MAQSQNTKPKTVCPMDRAAFAAYAKALECTIGNQPVIAGARSGKQEFSTGSFGWGASTKITVVVNGVAVPCQLSLNLTAIGSKDLTQAPAAASPAAELAPTMPAAAMVAAS